MNDGDIYSAVGQLNAKIKDTLFLNSRMGA